MKTITPVLSTLMLGLCAIAFSAQSQTSMPTTPGSSNVQSSTSTTPVAMSTMTKEQVEEKYTMDTKTCASMNDHAKDMCMEKAEENYTMAWKKMDPNHKPAH